MSYILFSFSLYRQHEDQDIRSLYHTLVVFDKIANLTLEEKDAKRKWHEHANFINALGDDKYYSMAHELLVVQEAINDEYYEAKGRDHQEQSQGTEDLSLKVRALRLEDHSIIHQHE